ncbi:MAG: hypothetical protein SPL58_05775 [Bacteroidaceae bacterium]|nr:hypothetical protein [Bacteroidaceae bacterium]
MKKICKAASLASLCVSLAGNVCAQQPLPLSLERMFELAETQNRALAVWSSMCSLPAGSGPISACS